MSLYVINSLFREAGSYVGKHPTPRGGEILKISKGGDYFLRIFWRGIDFLPLKGGISLTNLDQKSRIFLKFSKQFCFRGGYLQVLASKFLKGVGLFWSRQALLKGGSRNPKFFWGGISLPSLDACPRMLTFLSFESETFQKSNNMNLACFVGNE